MEDRQRDDSWCATHEHNKGKTSQANLQRGSERECANDTSSCPASKEMVASSLQSNVVEGLDSAGVSQTLEKCDVGSKEEIEAFVCKPGFASARPYRDVSRLKPNFCDRNGIEVSNQRPSFGMDGQSYKQEVREQQIQQWVLKHTVLNDFSPSDYWPDKYPEASHEIPKSVEQSEYGKHAEAGESHGISHPFSRTKLLFSDPEKVSLAKSKLQHHHVLMGASPDFGVLDASKRDVARKRKVECLKEEETKSSNIFMQSELIPGSKEWYSDNNEAGSFCTLRQWLNQPSRVVNRRECINIFKQILSLVHLAHSQGFVLGNICPSLFTISSTLQVSFTDSARSGSLFGSIHASTSGASLQGSFLDSRIVHSSIATLSKSEAQLSKQATPPNTSNIENDLEAFMGNFSNNKHFLSLNMLQRSATKVSEDLDFEAYIAGQSKKTSISSQKSGFCGMKLLHGGSRDSTGGLKVKSMSEDYLDVREPALKEGSICDLVQLDAHDSLHAFCAKEKKWYASPEEVSGATCSFASDIYCLGVLFFELFCSSRIREEYSKTMLDLRQRIMPSGMLTNQPKEAAFCLWLLHPNPDSRPRASELLHSEILGEDSEALEGRQADAYVEEVEAEIELLHDFLKELDKRKQGLLNKLVKDVTCLTSDINEVERRHSLLKQKAIICNDPQDDQALSSELIELEGNDRNLPSKFNPSWKGDISEASVRSNDMKMFKKGMEVGKESPQRQKELHSKCSRLMDNFDQLKQVYLSMRSKFPSSLENISTCSSENPNHSNAGASSAPIAPFAELGVQNVSAIAQNSDYLGHFFDSISKYAKYSKFEVKAVVRQRDLLKCSNMICSLGFDCDLEYFAAAGVCKRIKVFNCDAILNNSVDIHYPLMEMINESMLSSICWNSYIKSQIASGDYKGIVQLWDASTGQSVRQFKEHEKRTWSVDFSQTDPTKLASGSDDESVKLWSINQGSSIGTIKIKANVCCLQFSRDFGHLIAFGSADHKIYCYDLRSIQLPWLVLDGHKRAVSFVKFLDANMLVSASTDSTLKLWDVSQTHSAGGTSGISLLSYSGHTNEKNFVGLDVMDGYIACGSETNTVFAYHKSLPMPMASHKFGSVSGTIGQESEDDTGQFVSSVCWRGRSQTLIVANSMGNMKVLEMV